MSSPAGISSQDAEGSFVHVFPARTSSHRCNGCYKNLHKLLHVHAANNSVGRRRRGLRDGKKKREHENKRRRATGLQWALDQYETLWLLGQCGRESERNVPLLVYQRIKSRIKNPRKEKEAWQREEREEQRENLPKSIVTWENRGDCIIISSTKKNNVFIIFKHLIRTGPNQNTVEVKEKRASRKCERDYWQNLLINLSITRPYFSWNLENKKIDYVTAAGSRLSRGLDTTPLSLNFRFFSLPFLLNLIHTLLKV